MILNPHYNPPYRTPTPHDPSSSPTPPDPSPKRKRSNSTTALQIDTQHEPKLNGQKLTNEDAAPNSPRTKVANKLSGLDLRASRPVLPWEVVDGDGDGEGVARKRLKRTKEARKGFGGGDGGLMSTPPARQATSSSEADRDGNEAAAVVAETPDCRARPSSPPLPSSLPPQQADEDSDPSSGDFTTSCPSTTIFPPPPSPPTSSELTWHDDEITGHLLDRTNSDDDGEGINGIGFRPTPAMAFVRQQRRRQQVSEWKAREAREARQRRSERRRGVKGSEGEVVGGEVKERVVRFAVAEGEG
ncbi:uncharacterized protein LTR77_003289 [Saxophila tyrrhenica]|uniref:Uncharacterized protein n=1 Tax=Saxophila tyrrhenica TaxID=1690608 RepID=A0AAV9PKI6_9PEZI|nr:hypothetical protein LTR77_003289 [Saxophila tyrrhenica]